MELRHEHVNLRTDTPKRVAVEERAVGDVVYATINGVLVSWINEWSGVATSAPAVKTLATTTKAKVIATPVIASKKTSAKTTPIKAISTKTTPVNKTTPTNASSKKTSSTKAASAPAVNKNGVVPGSWSQQAYYNARSGTARGLTFLNNHGGAGSGVFTQAHFGMSLSYASSDASTGAASPEVLADMQLSSDVEVIIMSDKKCTNGDCGYYREGSVAYHGFGGAQKAFFFEFQMPHDTTSDYNMNLFDQPAIWLLNALIPRTMQYAYPSECSCWVSGCGEFDIFEVLDKKSPGNKRAKSTLQGGAGISGGDSDYFVRPTDKTIKAVLLKDGDLMHIKILDDSFSFGSSLTAAYINNIAYSTTTKSDNISLFNLTNPYAS